MRSAVFYPAKERRMARCDFWQIFTSSINACDANRIRSQTSKTCCWNLTVSSGQRRSTSTWSATMCYFPQARANYVQSCCSGANTSTTDYQWACHAPPMSSRRKSTSSSTDSNERIHAYLDDAVLLTTKSTWENHLKWTVVQKFARFLARVGLWIIFCKFRCHKNTYWILSIFQPIST